MEALRRLGRDVLTARDAGQAGRGVPDDEVLAFAHAQGRAVVTHNRRDFYKLHNAGCPHSGLVLCTEDADFERLAARIDAALTGWDGMTGWLVRVNRPPV